MSTTLWHPVMQKRLTPFSFFLVAGFQPMGRAFLVSPRPSGSPAMFQPGDPAKVNS